MVTTRSGSKRKSSEGGGPDLEESSVLEQLPSSPMSNKRQRLPVRRKGRPSAAGEATEEDAVPSTATAAAVAAAVRGREEEENADGDGKGGAAPETLQPAPRVDAEEKATAGDAMTGQENPKEKKTGESESGAQAKATQAVETTLPTVVKFDDAPSQVMSDSAPAAEASPAAVAPARDDGEEVAAEAMATEEADDSDDDGAPEAVSNVQAAAVAKEAAQAVKRTAKEGTQRLKRKRQERDALYKQQAEARKQNETETEAAAAAKEKVDGRSTAAGIVTGKVATGRTLDGPPTTSGPGPRRRQKPAVPDVLPPEFLESDEESDEDNSNSNKADEDAYQGDLSSVGGEPKRKKRRHNNKNRGHAAGASDDRTVGTAVYRVLQTSGSKLPPRKTGQAHQGRFSHMTKGRVPVKRSGGFLVRH